MGNVRTHERMNRKTRKQEQYLPGCGKHGFTLIEMIVSLGVFSILMGSISAIFIMASQVQRRTAISQRVLNDARYIMETIASDMRIGMVNYGAYTGGTISSPVTELYLIDEDNTPISYSRSTSGCSRSSSCLIRLVGGESASLTSQKVNADEILFYIIPASNPFGGGSDRKQPRVTITLTLSSVETGSDRSVISLQTTASSRYYGP